MNPTLQITNAIKNDEPIIFTKFGDGEYLCATQNFYFYGKFENHNCDKDSYTEKLSSSLKNAFLNIVDNSKNYIFGKWHHNDDVFNYFSNLTSKKINWSNYDALIFSPNDIMDAKKFINKINLLKTIKFSNRKKIIVCNELLVKSKILLNIDEVITIPLRNWFDEKYDDLINDISKCIEDKLNASENFILITCCGMSSKVLISDLYNKYPKGIYLDYGSGLDLICTKKVSREPLFTYEYLCHLFKMHGLIDEKWFDKKYDYIYDLAKNNLGIHLKR